VGEPVTAGLEAASVRTDFGPFSIIADGDGVHAAGFAEPEELRVRLPRAQRDRPVRLRPGLGAVSEAVESYFAGDLRALDTVPVVQPGNGFQVAAWRQMRAIPAGTTVTYTELAARAGNPRAVRAAGAACAANLVALFVPCHRVLRADGTLGGYYYRLDRKRRLLAHEGAVLAR
jgi:methylated-DNA-[protein]-cysteine S-methyltransferase